jgi:hypothetical protein
MITRYEFLEYWYRISPMVPIAPIETDELSIVDDIRQTYPALQETLPRFWMDVHVQSGSGIAEYQAYLVDYLLTAVTSEIEDIIYGR